MQPAGELSAAVRAAASAGSRLRPRSMGSDLRVDGGDLVATAAAGVTLEALDAALARENAWVALDAPGPRSRTLGAVLATAGSGPLAAGFGGPRDQVLGFTFVTGNGEIVKTGGRVVKNVAGFDLAKLLVGSFGAFGIIVEAHLRLRVRPAADRTIRIPGSLDDLAEMSARLMAAGVTPVAMEVFGGALLVRCMGSDVSIDEEIEACVRGVQGVQGVPIDVWDKWRDEVWSWPVVLRIGADPAGWLDALRLVPEAIGYSVTVPRGVVRVGLPSINKEKIAALRSSGRPVTLEHADDATLRACGVWGGLEPGVLGLTQRLRKVFDPNDVFDSPVLA